MAFDDVSTSTGFFEDICIFSKSEHLNCRPHFSHPGGVFVFYSLSQNNIPFQQQDNSVSIGKNLQIKPRKSEQG